MGAIIILIGDLASAPWDDATRMLATPDIDHLMGLAGLAYAQVRSLILALSLLAGISAIVETLDRTQRSGSHS